MKAIACVSLDGYLLPAALTPREDKRRFAALTAGGHCVVGRKTWDELPAKVRLGSAGRSYTVVSRGEAKVEAFVEWCDLSWAIDRYSSCQEDWIIGGNQIYDEFSAHTNFLYLSTVKLTSHEGSTWGKFPIDVSDAGRQDWDVLLNQDHGDHTFEILRRRM